MRSFSLALLVVLTVSSFAQAAISYTTSFGQLMYQTGRVRSQLFEAGSHDLVADDIVTPNSGSYICELKEFEVMMIGNGNPDRNYFGFYVFRDKPEVAGYSTYPGTMAFAKLGATSITKGASAGSGYNYYRVKFQLPADSFTMSPNTRYWIAAWRFGDGTKKWYTARRISGNLASGSTEGAHCRTNTNYPDTLFWGYPNTNDHWELAQAGKFWIHE